MGQVYRWIVAHDLHFPQYDRPTFLSMLALMRDIRPSGFIFGGDQFDNGEISHHNKQKHIYHERGSYKKNIERFDAEILRPIESIMGDGEKVWIIGNHDDWERQLIEENPEFEGWMERPAALRLEERGWEIVPLGHAKRLGQLNVIHGEILTGIGNQGCAFPSRKAVDLYGSNVLAGHTHSPQTFTKVSPVEQKKKHCGWINPILGATNPEYLRNRPTAWLNGFSVVEIYNASGFFNCYPIIVINGRFAYGGKVYDAQPLPKTRPHLPPYMIPAVQSGISSMRLN
ncbi:MAG: hypothetical protein WBW38_14035 [Candidatus Sulfotelmatobacter sp.]